MPTLPTPRARGLTMTRAYPLRCTRRGSRDGEPLPRLFRHRTPLPPIVRANANQNAWRREGPICLEQADRNRFACWSRSWLTPTDLVTRPAQPGHLQGQDEVRADEHHGPRPGRDDDRGQDVRGEGPCVCSVPLIDAARLADELRVEQDTVRCWRRSEAPLKPRSKGRAEQAGRGRAEHAQRRQKAIMAREIGDQGPGKLEGPRWTHESRC